MKYNQPYGVADEVSLFDHPYVNGDPSIGRQGSIPPAESIEYDQREIVKVIQWASDNKYVDMNGAPCVAPTNSLLDQLLKALFGIINSKALRADAVSYVNGSTGNDTTLDGTQSTVSGSHGPFATVDRALTEMAKYNIGGYNYNIIVADGTYTKSGPILLPLPNGSGSVNITGNLSTPTNCWFHNSSSGSTFKQLLGGNYNISGVRISNTSLLAGDPTGLIYTLAGQVSAHHISCSTSAGPHFAAAVNGFCFLFGPMSITGNASCHMLATENGRCLVDIPSNGVCTIANAVSFSTAFAFAQYLAYCRPTYGSFVNPGNVTGTRYVSSANSIINANGAGATFLPGTIAGSVSNGGLYL